MWRHLCSWNRFTKNSACTLLSLSKYWVFTWNPMYTQVVITVQSIQLMIAPTQVGIQDILFFSSTVQCTQIDSIIKLVLYTSQLERFVKKKNVLTQQLSVLSARISALYRFGLAWVQYCTVVYTWLFCLKTSFPFSLVPRPGFSSSSTSSSSSGLPSRFSRDASRFPKSSSSPRSEGRNTSMLFLDKGIMEKGEKKKYKLRDLENNGMSNADTFDLFKYKKQG